MVAERHIPSCAVRADAAGESSGGGKDSYASKNQRGRQVSVHVDRCMCVYAFIISDVVNTDHVSLAVDSQNNVVLFTVCSEYT